MDEEIAKKEAEIRRLRGEICDAVFRKELQKSFTLAWDLMSKKERQEIADALFKKMFGTRGRAKK